MLGRMARCVPHGRRDIAERQVIPIPYAFEGKSNIGAVEEHILSFDRTGVFTTER